MIGRYLRQKKAALAFPNSLKNPSNSTLYEREGVKNRFFFVPPVKTGAQYVFKSLKILDSGFRRNDGKKRKTIFSQLQAGKGAVDS